MRTAQLFAASLTAFSPSPETTEHQQQYYITLLLLYKFKGKFTTADARKDPKRTAKSA